MSGIGGRIVALIIRPLTAQDLSEAGRIIRLAFGTFLGAPEPEQFWADMDYAHTRWRADPTAAFGAELDGELVGSNFATRWGSVGLFGPVSVRPDLWDQDIGQRLMEPVMACFRTWGVQHVGLFTFAHSPKHVGLYQKYGFWPRFLTAVMSKPVAPGTSPGSWSRYAELPECEQAVCLRACRMVTESVYPGLDVEREIRAVHAQALGDTALLWEDHELVGFAVCHCGPGTEAGHEKCYIKFGAVLPGPAAEARFARLLDACEALATARDLTRVEAGVNLGREEAYRVLRAHGFLTDFQGVTMHQPNEPGYHRPGVYVIDDWR
jgi:GNAT superfamily N-acetyltransferase